MTKRLKQQVIKVKNYGDESINRLAVILAALEPMDERQRQAAINFITSYYNDRRKAS